MSDDVEGQPASSLPDVFRLLGNRRRLLTIGYLSLYDEGAVVDVRQVARVVRGVETETPPRNLRRADYESAYNSLIQQHLPKLDEEGVVEYDADRKAIRVTHEIDSYSLLAAIAGGLVLNHGTQLRSPIEVAVFTEAKLLPKII